VPSKKFLRKYGLRVGEVKNIDLRETYAQCTPGRPVDSFFGDNGMMIDSPHVEFAQLYYKHGLKWMKNNYKTTKLYLFKSKLRKKGFAVGMVDICESIKRGYLHGKHASDHIIVLNTPFCNSRYDLKEDGGRVPEVFAGHHRIGALLALKKFVVPVLFCIDGCPGSKFSQGKIHLACCGGT